MTSVPVYHRPISLDEAVRLLAVEGSAIVAGGTVMNAGTRPASSILVDLQSLGLEGVQRPSDTTLIIGAMTRLSDLAGHELVPEWLRELARKELPSSLRTLATVGGTVAAGGWQSVLVAGLLSGDAVVSIIGPDGSTQVALSELLDDVHRLKSQIITAVRLDVSGSTAVHATARTRADQPIVACVARLASGGLRVAMSGVATTAVLVDDVDRLAPPGDFRGSAEYRQHLARVLRARALADLGVAR